jgi:hypothetical protein
MALLLGALPSRVRQALFVKEHPDLFWGSSAAYVGNAMLLV